MNQSTKSKVTETNNTALAGFLLVRKPTGVSSFFCVKRIKHILGKRAKVGHAGTLDSFATGLLIIAIDRTATRRIDELMQLDKVYVAQAKLGQLTDTLDFTGELLEDESVSVTREQLEDAIASFGAEYLQTPPIFSALKVSGRRLSELARSGKKSAEELRAIARRKIRTVQLHKLELQKFEPPFFTVYAHVSHGAYIRTLMEDIAQKLGTHATTHELSREAIGPFTLERAIEMDSLDCQDAIQRNLLSLDQVFAKLNNYAK